jgi:hypothetical protein
MGSFKPLDLEILDRVYEAAWAALQALDPFRDTDKDGERQDMPENWSSSRCFLRCWRSWCATPMSPFQW